MKKNGRGGGKKKECKHFISNILFISLSNADAYACRETISMNNGNVSILTVNSYTSFMTLSSILAKKIICSVNKIFCQQICGKKKSCYFFFRLSVFEFSFEFNKSWLFLVTRKQLTLNRGHRAQYSLIKQQINRFLRLLLGMS